MKHHPFSSPPPADAEQQSAISVSQVVEAWDQSLRCLGAVQVMGELSAFSLSTNGHAYFTLSDGRCSLSGMLWRDRVRALAWTPAVGDQVLVNGRAQIYKAKGRANFEASAMFPAGDGLQAAALKALELRLEREGLFDASLKKNIPLLPKKVGVVSSSKADGLQDFLRSRTLRAPGIALLFAESPVQGALAAEGLAAAIDRLDASGLCDVIALVRGGGSSSDLLPFSDERVVRAVARCKTPIVVGVGHQPDHPICERAADKIAHTPTHAAELIFADTGLMRQQLQNFEQRLSRPLRQRLRGEGQDLQLRGHRLRGAINNRLIDARRGLSRQAQTLADGHPARRLQRRQAELAELVQRLGQSSPQPGLASARGGWELVQRRLMVAGSGHLQRARQNLVVLQQRLHAASAQAVLERGFVLVVGEAGETLTSAGQSHAGDQVTLRFADGQRRARIEGDKDDR